MAHACNPSYLGGQYWNYHGSWPAQAKTLQDPTQWEKVGQGDICLSSQLWRKGKIGDLKSRLAWIKSETLYQNIQQTGLEVWFKQ
jgi:hypothetical protein